MRLLMALGLGVAVLATACGGADGDVGGTGEAVASDPTLPANEPVDDEASSTLETRSAVCQAQTSKRCLDRADLPACESELAVFTEKYVLALGRCVDRLASCESRSAVQVCKEEALLEIAPGFPDLPEIARCKTKNVACSTAYPRDRQIKPQIDGACERLIALEGEARKRAGACVDEHGCRQFADCLQAVY